MAAAVTASLGMLKDSVVILVVIVINSIIGSWQELRAEQSLRALQKLSVPKARVLRDGVEVELDSASLVPGDVVVLVSGDKIPADLRLMASKELRVEEATLTGESLPVTKKADAISEEGLTPGDQINMAFMGTVVVSGRARGLVAATGVHTLLGQIAESVLALRLPPKKERDIVCVFWYTLAHGNYKHDSGTVGECRREGTGQGVAQRQQGQRAGSTGAPCV